jgi:hypothetical protein
MMSKPPWLGWLVSTGETLLTADGKVVEVWEFRHQDCPEVLLIYVHSNLGH